MNFQKIQAAAVTRPALAEYVRASPAVSTSSCPSPMDASAVCRELFHLFEEHLGDFNRLMLRKATRRRSTPIRISVWYSSSGRPCQVWSPRIHLLLRARSEIVRVFAWHNKI